MLGEIEKQFILARDCAKRQGPLPTYLAEMGTNPECRSRLRQDSAFVFRTRIRSQKFVKNRTRIRSQFSILAVAGVFVVIS